MNAGRMKTMTRPIAIAGILLYLTSSPVSAHEGHQEAPGTETAAPSMGPVRVDEETRRNIDLRTEKVELRSIQTVFAATGRIEPIPARSGAVSSRISGRITQIFTNEGESVTKGQPIAEVESRQLGDPPPRVVYRAPLAGIVTDRHVVAGDSVNPDAHLFEIADLREVYAVAQIFGGEVSLVRKGAKVRLRVDSLPEKAFDGNIELISGAVDPASGSLRVFARVANPGQLLRPGMRASISVVTGESGLATAVPKAAVLGEFGSFFVFLQGKDPLTFERRNVQLGMADDRYQEILEGVAPGDMVVVQGNYQLQYVTPSATVPEAHEEGPAEAGEKTKEGARSGTPWIVGGLVLLVAACGLWVVHRFRTSGATPAAGR
jgi:multidrug efflux pump subunit AcrA (membrane-fusion protein)